MRCEQEAALPCCSVGHTPAGVEGLEIFCLPPLALEEQVSILLHPEALAFQLRLLSQSVLGTGKIQGTDT